jgi:hypothetical protein
MQQSLSIYYMTADRAGELRFSDVTPAVIEFLRLFGTFKHDRVEMVGVQRATAGLKADVAAFCVAHSRRAPQLNAFAKLIRDLQDNEAFLLLPSEPRSTAERVRHENVIAQLNGTATAEDIVNGDGLFAGVVAEYDLTIPRTDRHTVIGNKRRSERCCRFCTRSMADGATFKNEAHAISAALGNRYLKLADECDTCNDYFGEGIEPHLIALLDLPRVMLGIQGRGKMGGRPEIPLRGGRMFNDGERVIIECEVDNLEHTGEALSIYAAETMPIIPERCYRALGKFALSVVPEKELVHLGATANWVRYGERPEGRALPLVATNTISLPRASCAQITLYVRRSELSRLPHVVGEFRLGCYLYAFTLPFSARDGDDFAFFGDQQFMDTFRHYARVGGWRMVDFGITRPIAAPTLRLEKANEPGGVVSHDCERQIPVPPET